MKRLFVFSLFVICVTLMISSCAYPAEDPAVSNTPSTMLSGTETAVDTTANNAVATAPTHGNTAPTAPPVNDPYPQYVQTDINEIIEGSDQHRNNWTIPICIPKLLPFSQDAIACQHEIYSYFYSNVEGIRNDSSQGCWPTVSSIQHRVYLNEDILSVVIQESTNIDIDIYHVYNFNIKSGKQLNTEELMNELQILDYKEKIAEAAKDFYKANNVGFEKDKDYNERLEQTIGTENITKAAPYITDNGSIMVVVNIYSLAGAEYYPKAIPLA